MDCREHNWTWVLKSKLTTIFQGQSNLLEAAWVHLRLDKLRQASELPFY